MKWRPRFTHRRTKTSPQGTHAQALGVKLAYWPCTHGPAVEFVLGSHVFSFFLGTKEYW